MKFKLFLFMVMFCILVSFCYSDISSLDLQVSYIDTSKSMSLDDSKYFNDISLIENKQYLFSIKNNDYDINSELINYFYDYENQNTIFEIKSDLIYYAWFDDNGVKTENIKYYKDINNFIVFKGILHGYLHIGKDSDIYDISLSSVSGSVSSFWNDNILNNGSLVTDGLIAYWDLNEDAVDIVGNHNGVITGATNSTGHLGGSNTAMEFDTNEYIDFGNLGNFSDTGISYSFWFNIENTNHDDLFSQDWDASPTTSDYASQCYVLDTEVFTCQFVNTAGAVTTSAYSTAINMGVWYHGVFTHNGSNQYLYLNGVLVDTDSSANPKLDSTDNLFINRVQVSQTYYSRLDGSIDNVRIYNRSLSVDEIKALYQERNDNHLNGSLSTAFCIKDCINETGILAQYKFDTNANDYYGNYNGTLTGTITNVTNCKYGNCYNFEGTTNYINFGKADFLSNKTAFTISTWVNFDGNPSGTGDYLYDQIYNTTLRTFIYSDSTPRVRFCVGNEVATGEVVINNFVTPKVWTYVTMVYDGSQNDSDRIKVYKNGVLQSITSSSGTIPAVTGNYALEDFEIGSSQANYEFDGKIDNFMIYNRSLSDKEVYNLYLSGYETYLENASLNKITYNGGNAECYFYNNTGRNYTFGYDYLFSNFTKYYSNNSNALFTSYDNNENISVNDDFGICSITNGYTYFNMTFSTFYIYDIISPSVKLNNFVSYSNINNYTINYSIIDDNFYNITVYMFNDSSLIYTDTIFYDLNPVFNYNLENGQYSFLSYAYDNNSNLNISEISYFIINNTPPIINAIYPSNNSVIHNNIINFIFNHNNPSNLTEIKLFLFKDSVSIRNITVNNNVNNILLYDIPNGNLSYYIYIESLYGYNYTETIYFTNIYVTETEAWLTINLLPQSDVILAFVIFIAFLGLICIGLYFSNPAFQILGYLFGIFFGIFFLKVNMLFGILFMVSCLISMLISVFK